jgi:hypothetical protein
MRVFTKVTVFVTGTGEICQKWIGLAGLTILG